MVSEPGQLLEELAAHPGLLDAPVAKVCASLAAALAHRPAQAAALMDEVIARGRRLEEWPPGIFREGQLTPGPAADAVKRLAAQLDATEAPRDEARRELALKRFADELRALAADAQ